MCGIAGIFNINNAVRLQARPIKQMTQSMRLRGPDDEGYLLVNVQGGYECVGGKDSYIQKSTDCVYPFSPDKNIDKIQEQPTQLALGHRRLSILDLTNSGHQPMCTQDKRYWIVFNGEIYNYQELTAKLKNKNTFFNGTSDTEVLLYLYSYYGKKCLQYLNGDFAFAIWDNKRRTLFCARDRMGIKPFYYTIQNNQFIFASDIKAIIASGLYTPQPAPEGLYLAMAFGIAPRPLTAFQGIRALEQGTWLEIGLGGDIKTGRYWEIPIGTQDHGMSENEAAELLEQELLAATRLRLVADVPVGTFMSGGIDSTTISAMASRFHPGIKAFTLAYENNAPEMDETLQAIATAKMNPIEHIVHTVNPDNTLQYLAQWIEGYEEPFHSLAANFVISKLVKDNEVTVVLNGLGGDELFAGYGYYRYARFFPLLKIAKPLSYIAQFFPYSKIGRVAKFGSVRTADQLHTLLFSQTSDAYRQSLLPLFKDKDDYTIKKLHELYVGDKKFDDAIEALNYMDLMNYIGNHHVHRVDQFTMAHSVEGRFPFLDHNVISAAFKIPSKYKIKSGVQKYILRNVAQKYIHPSCLSMKKKGFGLPLAQWMKGPLKNLVEEKIEALKQRKVVNAQFISNIYNKYLQQKMSSTKIWHLVALELWFERFIDQDKDFLSSYKFNS